MNFTVAFKCNAALALAAVFCSLPCLAGEGATFIPPKGWTEGAAHFKREGIIPQYSFWISIGQDASNSS